MKKARFRQANSRCGYMYISDEHNSIIMQFKPSVLDMIKMLIGIPIWVGAPIRARHGTFSVKVTMTAFKEGE